MTSPVRAARITEAPLSVDRLLGLVQDSTVGGIALFVGVVRDHDSGAEVVSLDYSQHPSAEATLVRCAEQTAAEHDVVSWRSSTGWDTSRSATCRRRRRRRGPPRTGPGGVRPPDQHAQGRGADLEGAALRLRGHGLGRAARRRSTGLSRGQDRRLVTRQTWTAFVSALLFVGLALLLVVIPVPFVSWSPGGPGHPGDGGQRADHRVQGIDTYPTTGRLDMTIVSTTPADARLQPAAGAAGLLAALIGTRCPEDVIYDPGKSVEQVTDEDAEMMETAQDDAVVAALRADG